jgi:hypothetical protein
VSEPIVDQKPMTQAVATHADDDLGAPSLRERLRGAALVPARMLGAMFLPDRTMPLVVREERYAGAFLVVTLAALIAAGVTGARYDGSAAVLARNAGKMPTQTAGGVPEGNTAEAPKSDRDIADEITKDRAVTRVKLGLGAGAGTPFSIVMLAMGLFLVGRYVGGKPSMKGTISVASYASLPSAARSITQAVIAWRMPVVRPADLGHLVPSFSVANPALGRLLGGVDVFTIWTALLAIFGLATAGSMSRKRAFVTVIVSLALWLAVTRLVAGGPPPGPGPNGPNHGGMS